MKLMKPLIDYKDLGLKWFVNLWLLVTAKWESTVASYPHMITYFIYTEPQLWIRFYQLEQHAPTIYSKYRTQLYRLEKRTHNYNRMCSKRIATGPGVITLH